MNSSYSKWDKWANEIDENGDEKKETPKFDKPTCVFGKPMTEQEFLNRNDKDTPIISSNASEKSQQDELS